MPIGLVTLVVCDYDEAISFFVGKLGWDLRENVASLTNDGRPKRWVVVAPKDGGPGLLLAQADGAEQAARVGDQTGGRVAFFLETDDFERDFDAFTAAGVEFTRPPKTEPYGKVAVFRDVAGNLWDLIERA
ncbi:MAG: VOC family protein [Pseudomonadota bacterium]